MDLRPGTDEFHRPARVVPTPVERSIISITTPPTVPEPPASAVWQVLAPVLGSVGMLIFAISVGGPRYVLMAGFAAGAMVTSGIASRVIAGRASARNRAVTAARYRTHLEEVRARLERAAAEHRSWSELANPSPRLLGELVSQRSRVWERRRHDPDFWTVRLGTGTVEAPVAPKLERTTDPMSISDPELAAEAEALAEHSSHLCDMPVAVDLREVHCVAVVGERQHTRRLCAALVSQLAALRSPSDLRLMAHLPADAAADWEWMKWLPHARKLRTVGDDGSTFLTTEVEALRANLELISRKPGGAPLGDGDTRKTVVLVDGYAPRTEVADHLATVLRDSAQLETLLLVIADRAEDIPSEATASITIDESGSLTYREMRADGVRISGITPDPFDASLCEEIARGIAPLRERLTDAHDLESIGLLDLLERPVGQESLLSTPIGLDSEGRPLVLDLREPALGGMGPHGMIIGATGSGKSELLRTLVLGLAAHNTPENLSFVFADFKGGATFAGLESLPHVAGSISNLESDPTIVDRMQEAIYGELERRQRLLRDAGLDGAGDYRRRRRDAESALEPMPSLLLVIDEFGELLASRPDFADLFTSIGRTGRSLGVHLLLSSQRLDEGRMRRVEGHLRYRICLRTFTPEESQTVIGSNASFDLPPVPGLGHIAIDSELTRFRAATVNRPLRNAPRAPTTVRRYAIDGPASRRHEEVASPRPGEESEMDVLVDRLAGGTPMRAVLPKPLPGRLDFDPAPDTGPLEISIGRSDLPRRQETPRSMLDFSGSAGNLAVVGGPRSGKSTTLATVITSFSAGKSPEEVAFHAVDLGGGTLHRFESLPHVGSVFGRHHREEIPGLVRQMRTLIEDRIGRAHEFPSSPVGRHATSPTSHRGHVFLVIDDWGRFTSEFGCRLSGAVTEIAASGLHFGVHVILSAGRWQDIQMSLRDAIGGRLELRLTDPVESEIDRQAAGSLPTGVPGRAIDGSGRLTQVMCPPDEFDWIAERWATATPVPPIRTIPSLLSPDDIPADSGIGVCEDGPDPWGPDLFGSDPHFLFLGDTESGKTTALRGLLRMLHRRSDTSVGVIDLRHHLAGEHLELGRATSTGDAGTLIDGILTEISRRRSDGLHHRGRRDLVLVVDDYDLVAGAASNPLDRLADNLPRGRDLGFHLVVARRVAGMSRSSFEPTMQRLRELGTPTLLLDGDPTEGPVAGSVKASRRPPGRGLLVSRSRTTLVQVARFEQAMPAVDLPHTRTA